MKKMLLVTTAILLQSLNAEAGSMLKGNYVVSGTDSCLYTPGTFDANWNVIGSSSAVTAYGIVQGFATFDGTSTGTMNLTTIFSPDMRYKFGTASIEYASVYQGSINFSYAMNASDDGLFSLTETSGTDIGSITGGTFNGQSYIINGVALWNGSISGGGRNHTLMMSTSTPSIETISYSGGQAMQGICVRTRTFVKSDIDDTN